MKGQLFLHIASLLTTKVPELQQIDVDRGQLDQADLTGLSFPLALIGFGETNYQDEGQGLQYGESIVDIHVVQQHADLNTTTPAQATIATLLDFPNKVYLALQDAGSSSFFNFTRLREQANQVRDGLMIDVLQFVTTINDDTKRVENELGRTEVPEATTQIN
ncbi:hypothetical protein [Microscilla marina]|uniref:Uncharacterized protein n=1 Tax=Microscilla marina ATCC 23134 TaxID=313606 RepID=A1ZLH4_MICM2|nr:hypothetical protein [Microscilla marina]EAY28728.1 hypothetical protein M23134_07826 [Microscilla marina ATCC 23134]